MATEHFTTTFDIPILKQWLQVCDDHHGSECHAEPISERPQHSMPDWVIDTENQCIVPGSSVQKYAALSYTWQSPMSSQGLEADRLMLKKGNLDDFKRHGYLATGVLESIPAVVKDSINLIRFSGIRYLWVDCLCIVQYDETTRDSVSRMGEIYSGAYLTIMAAGHHEGLQGSLHNYERYLAEGYQRNDTNHAPINYPDLERLHSSLLRSHWASRGWTFQEQLLAKRSLIFLDDLYFWDCQSRVCFTGPDGEQYTLDVHNPGKSNWRNLGPLSPIPNFSLFIELVCRYSNRSLTYEQDTLPAFSGVLDEFARNSFPGGFVSGLPSLFLDTALLWQPLYKARRRSFADGVSKFAPLAPLPSWSWVGWKCLLDPRSLGNGIEGSWFSKEEDIWTTKKLVDWCTYSHDGVLEPITEPSMLQRFKDYRTTSCNDPLPPGWTRKITAKPIQIHDKRTSAEWFVHESQPETLHRYPLPLYEASDAGMTVRNPLRLSCITTKATFRARRVLTATSVGGGYCYQSMSSISAAETELYNFKPNPGECCPVVSLEDGQGTSAGALRIMDSETTVQPQEELTLVAVSTGSAPRHVVARGYEEHVDCKGYWVFGSGYTSFYRVSFTSNPECQPPQDISPYPSDSIDPQEIPEMGFYNVIWVKITDGIMYRQAVGRVPKEVWEQNCGKPERIVLG